MKHTQRTIHVEPGGELDRILEESAGTTVVLEQRGKRYRLVPIDVAAEEHPTSLADEGDIWANYSPEQVQLGLRRSRGILQEIDHERLKRDLRDQRAQDTHGRPA